jgi:hypothetical protein
MSSFFSADLLQSYSIFANTGHFSESLLTFHYLPSNSSGPSQYCHHCHSSEYKYYKIAIKRKSLLPQSAAENEGRHARFPQINQREEAFSARNEAEEFVKVFSAGGPAIKAAITTYSGERHVSFSPENRQ